METLNIRFIGHYKDGNNPTPEYYTLQIKRWYGWRDVLDWIEGGMDPICNRRSAITKPELLKTIYEERRTTPDFLRIREYPELKQY